MGEFIEWLSGTHTCECGALYKIRTSRTPPEHGQREL